MTNKEVLVIGGGVAGLSTAVALVPFGIRVQVVDKANFMGGHAIQYTCKATDRCVKCGACMVEEKLSQATAHPHITLTTGSQINRITKNGRFQAVIAHQPEYIDSDKCTDCGRCFDQCPAKGAITQGSSSHHHPFFAVNKDHCLYLKNDPCTICQDVCPENAIDLDKKPSTSKVQPDAVIVATGFKPFNPVSKPYGYQTFPNVITSLELERMLRRTGRVTRPSDGNPVQRIAFIQCVGSRDAKAGHLWCSQVCCGSALRMAGLIKSRQADTAITFYYIDVQTFGKDFDRYYGLIKKDVRMIRSIPGDIYPSDGNRLKVIFADDGTHESKEAIFDLVVLSVGMTPLSDIKAHGDQMGLSFSETGFIQPTKSPSPSSEKGVFTAGTATGPMGIAGAIADAGNAAWQTIRFLGVAPGEEK